MMNMRDARGFSMIEALIAFVILMLMIGSVLMLFSQGTRAIAATKIDRKVAECATLLMEYLGSIPPDVIFSQYPATKVSSDFNSSESFYDLKNFLDNSTAGQECIALSKQPGMPDHGINLRFDICPSCEYGCVGGAAACSGVGASAQCIYDYVVRFYWDNPFPSMRTTGGDYGKPMEATYQYKRFTNTLQDCLTAGCPSAAAGEGLGRMECTL